MAGKNQAPLHLVLFKKSEEEDNVTNANTRNLEHRGKLSLFPEYKKY